MSPHRIAPTAMGLLFVLIGLVVGIGGVWLMALGGSWYYLPAGLLMVLTGLLLLQGNPSALWAHAALLASTLAWSVWESGLDGWALAARSNVVWLLGLVMLTPWFMRGLDASASVAGRRGLATALALFAAVGLGGTLYPGPGARGAATPAVAHLNPGATPQTALVADGAMLHVPAGPAPRLAPRAMPAVLEVPEMLSPPLPPVSPCPSLLLVPAAHGRLVAFNQDETSDCDAAHDSEPDRGVNVIEFPPFKGVVDHVSWHEAVQALHRHIHALSAGPSDTWPMQARQAVHGASTTSSGGVSEGSTSVTRVATPALKGSDMWGLTLFDQLACRIAFEKMRFDGRFARPMTQSLLMQMPQPGGRELMVSGPYALMFTAEVVALPGTPYARPSHAPVAEALMIRAADHGAATEVAESTSQPAASAPYAVRLQPFLSPVGLPCQAPPWRLRPAAPAPLQALQPAAPLAPGYPLSGRPVAVADAEAPAL